ncbi:HNH endonuclease [Priestia aryabhattai]|uniref:HNH endonuclease n=1 Tax=Priestia aryabhattai TaxID=412384 RepID=UPI0035325358
MFKTGIFSMKYYNTYYFSNIISNAVLHELQFPGSTEAYRFFLRCKTYKEFPKFSNLHSFIFFVIKETLREDDRNWPNINKDNYINVTFQVNKLMNYHDIDHLSFYQWYEKINQQTFEYWDDAATAYYQDLLEGPLLDLLKRLTDEVFYVLFQNRFLLKEFNQLIADHIRLLTFEEIEDKDISLFEREGCLKRCYVNQWVKSAVFYRDRGHCCCCNKDLTSLISILDTEVHFDHIVPLSKGGANDISNIQLMCEGCNGRKGTESTTYNLYQLWYSKE